MKKLKDIFQYLLFGITAMTVFYVWYLILVEVIKLIFAFLGLIFNI